ncbi:MAG: ParB/RepB/Spo0J family partition protein [Candidatus Saccharimonadales bacterium]
MVKNKAGLGKGFGALIPDNFDSSLLTDEQERIQKLLIADISPGKMQPRTEFDDVALSELASSIKQHGILQPLIVRVDDSGYRLVAGERRWRAAQLAGLKQVPAIVRSLEELEELELALVENVQREDLSPLDQAMSIHRLLNQFNLKQEVIAQRLGKANSTIGNILRLLNLPVNVQEALRDGLISEGHARAILGLGPNPEKQTEMLQLIIKNKWSVRQAEQFVVASRKGAASDKARKQLATTTPATEKLGKKLGAPVSIKRTAKGGKLEIAFKTNSQLEQLISKLAKSN